MSFEVVAVRDIEAPPHVVFSGLVDVARWHEWCTWLAWDHGEMREGATLGLRLTPPGGGGYGFTPTVLTVDAPRHLAWIGRTGLPGVFDGEHHFEIAPRAFPCDPFTSRARTEQVAFSRRSGTGRFGMTRCSRDACSQRARWK